jgi:hypothetical protein
MPWRLRSCIKNPRSVGPHPVHSPPVGLRTAPNPATVAAFVPRHLVPGLALRDTLTPKPSKVAPPAPPPSPSTAAEAGHEYDPATPAPVGAFSSARR